MNDRYKTRRQLIAELTEMRQCVSELEKNKDSHNQPDRILFDDSSNCSNEDGMIKHLNSVLRAIRNVNQLITKEKNSDKLISRSCDLLVETRGYTGAWLILVDTDQEPVASAQAGYGDEFSALIKQVKSGQLNECSKRALKHSGVVIFADPRSVCGDCPLLGLESGVRTLTIRLEHGSRIFGLLSVAIPAKLPLVEEEQQLFEEVAADIAYALNVIEMDETRKRTAKRLQESEERFRTLYENSTIGLYRTTPDGKIILANPSLVKMLGYSSFDELRKRNLKQEGFEPNYPREEFKKEIDQKEEVRGIESRWKRKDGEIIYVRESARAVRDKNGKVCHYEGTVEDITERKRAEDKLWESENLFHTLYNNLPGGMILIDSNYRIKDVSRKTCEITKYSRDELVGELCDIICPKGSKSKKCLIWAAGNDDFEGMDTAIKCKNGYRYPILKNAKRVLVNGEQHVLEVFQDTRLQKKTENDLRQSEEKFRLLAENSVDCIWTMDTRLRFTYLSPALKRMAGFKPEQWVGTRLNSHFRKKEFLKVSALTANALKNYKTFGHVTFETKILNSDNKEVAVEINGKVLRDRQGRLIGLQGTIRDITERIQTEKEIRAVNNKLQKIFDSSTSAIIMVDSNGHITAWNKASEEIFGWTKQEVIGKFNPTVPEAMKKLYFETIAKKMKNIELKVLRKNSSLVDILLSTNPLFDEHQNLVGVVEVMTDISDRKRNEAKRAKLEAQLRRSQKMETIGTLAGGIAHDFNNILTPIMGYTDMAILGLPPDDPVVDDLRNVLKGAQRAKDLVQQILTFSRQIEQERKPLKLHLIVKEAIQLLRPTIPTTIEIQQRIDVFCDKVLADPSQIHQVIVNLCTNAYQAMEDTGGTLTIELKQVEVDAATIKNYPNLKEAKYVQLTVSDTGIGIDDANRERIFEPFFTTKAVDKGTGMGLSVVHGIVRSHQGEIIVHSEPGEGSTFHVYLPTVNAVSESDTKEAVTIRGDQEKILVVDDEKEVAQVMQRMLVKLGYRVVVCTSSIEALKMFRQQAESYELVITDLTMPEMTGLDLLQQLQKIRPELPLIIMTGYGERVTDSVKKRYGILHVIGKPIRIDQLASAVHAVLKKL